ncbi:MAG: histidine kinase dimerization/phospho-acceptor domain-containing protein, partial [Pseudomonadota bacterium]
MGDFVGEALLGVGVAAAVLALVLVLRRVGPLAIWRGRGEAQLFPDGDGAPIATLTTRMNGEAVAQNSAMDAKVPQKLATIEEAAETLADGLGEGEIYRLARTAAESGFAGCPITCKRDRASFYIGCQRLGEDRLCWSFLPLEEGGVGASRPVRELPVPAMRVSEAGDTAANTAYETLFAPLPNHVAAELGHLAAGEAAVVMLPASDGTVLRRRAVALDDEEGSTGRTLIFLPERGTAHRRSTLSPVLDQVPVGLIQCGLGGRALWSNRVAIQMLGREPQPGDPLEDLLTPLSGSISKAVNDAVARRGPMRGLMVRGKGASEERVFQLGLLRIEDDGADSLLAVLNDAREIKELEDRFAQSQKMEAIGKLAGGVAHDFNNVLTAIQGHCDFVLMGKDRTHPDHDDLIQIRQNTNRAASMVRHLLAFSRQQTLQQVQLNLRDVISDAHI